VSRVKRLIQSYGTYIAVPWRGDAAAAQRVIFCVYNETEERWLRAKVDEFEIVTRQAGHDWAVFDLTDAFSTWLACFLKVKEVVDKLAPTVKGRLLVFFPGSFENNNYRLLDGYDGWNYLAVPITADREF